MREEASCPYSELNKSRVIVRVKGGQARPVTVAFPEWLIGPVSFLQMNLKALAIGTPINLRTAFERSARARIRPASICSGVMMGVPKGVVLLI